MNILYLINEIVQIFEVMLMIGCGFIAFCALCTGFRTSIVGNRTIYCITSIVYLFLSMDFSSRYGVLSLPVIKDIYMIKPLIAFWVLGSIFVKFLVAKEKASNNVDSDMIKDGKSLKPKFNSIKGGSTVVISIVCIILCVMFFNSKLNYLPHKTSTTNDNWVSKTFSPETTEPISTNDYILLSTLTDSVLFKYMDLLVEKDTFIPSKEDIGNTYSGLYSDTIVASLVGTDIIIQDYDIEITEEIDLENFREQIVYSIQNSRQDINFDTNRTLVIDNLEIPVIEFSTEYDKRVTYSFIALVDVKGKFITIAVNSGNTLSDARQFFDTLLSNMVIK